MKRGERGRPVEALLEEAKELRDPYYTALALMALSTDPRLPLDRATSTAKLGLEHARDESRDWRMAELLGELARMLSTWRQRPGRDGKRGKHGGHVRNGKHGKEGPDDEESLGPLFAKLVKIASSMPSGKERTEAVKNIARKVHWHHANDLMLLALSVEGDAKVKEGRSVIKGWARSLGSDGLDHEAREGPIDEMTRMILEVHEPSHRSKLLGYLHLQLDKEKLTAPGKGGTLIQALEAADGIPDEDTRLEVLRYLSTITATGEELQSLKTRAGEFKEPSLAIRLLTTLAGRADKLRATPLTVEWLKEAESLLGRGSGSGSGSGIEVKERMNMMLNLVQGYAKAGFEDEATRVLGTVRGECEAMDEGELRETMLTRVEHAGKRLKPAASSPKGPPASKAVMHGATPSKGPPAGDAPPRDMPASKATAAQDVPPRDMPASKAMPIRATSSKDAPSRSKPASDAMPARATPSEAGTRHVLVLHDAYEGGLKPPHLRALARAAPLCVAYDLDLGLLGFPADPVESIVERTVRETNVGQGGSLLEQLHTQDRVKLIGPGGQSGLEALAQLGLPVATTSNPWEGKRVELEDIMAKQAEQAREQEAKGQQAKGQGAKGQEAKGQGAEQRNLCVIMGLGRQGLPASLLKEVPYHLELTGKNVSLETATVMGIIAQRLHDLSR